MKHLFVPYEIALKLKEKGFKEECLSGYVEISTNKFEWMMNSQIDAVDEEYCLGSNLITKAPLYQQVIDWFRDKYNIEITVQHAENFDFWKFNINKIANNYSEPYYSISQNIRLHHKSYYEALNKAIEEVFNLT